MKEQIEKVTWLEEYEVVVMKLQRCHMSSKK